jgi:hypothetical protein
MMDEIKAAIEEANARLSRHLLAGRNTAGLRQEIAALHQRLVEVQREAAEQQAAQRAARAAAIAAEAEQLAVEAESRIDASLASLTPSPFQE